MRLDLGIVMRVLDQAVMQRAAALDLPVLVTADEAYCPFERNLVLMPGVAVPWDQVAAGFELVGSWDAAAPLWSYDVVAEKLGNHHERCATEHMLLDLRVPVYACELLFVQGNEVGRALLEQWQIECACGPDVRLAFLRALALVKPRLCPLPTTWLMSFEARAALDKPAAKRRGRR